MKKGKDRSKFDKNLCFLDWKYLKTRTLLYLFILIGFGYNTYLLFTE